LNGADRPAAPRDEAKDQRLQQIIVHLRDAARRQDPRLGMFAQGEERCGGIGAADEDAAPFPCRVVTMPCSSSSRSAGRPRPDQAGSSFSDPSRDSGASQRADLRPRSIPG